MQLVDDVLLWAGQDFWRTQQKHIVYTSGESTSKLLSAYKAGIQKSILMLKNEY